MKRTGPTNEELRILIAELKALYLKEDAPIWKRLAFDLSKATRQRRVVNLSRINRFTKSKDLVVIPGKVLGTGDLDHDVTIAAWQFSSSARDKLKNILSIQDLMKSNPKGKKLRIIG